MIRKKKTHEDPICASCGLCNGTLCKNLLNEMELRYEYPKTFPQNYGGIRFTADAMDCGLPIAIDSHSGCSYNCLYCFSNNLQRAADRNPKKLQSIIKNGSFYSEWPIKRLEAFLARDLKDNQSKAMYKVLDSGVPVQLGALGDPFDDLELHSGWAKKAIPLFIKYKIPVRVGTKGGIALQKPEYLKLFEKSPDQFWFAFSIISNSDDLIRKVDLRAPVTTDRLKAMKKLTEMGCKASIRFRPFLPGISDAYEGEPEAWKTLITRAKGSGAQAISFEYIFLNPVPTPKQKEMYRLMFRAMKNPKFAEQWHEASKLGETCRRGSREMKYAMTMKVKEHIHSLDMVFGISDPHFKEENDTEMCCFSANTSVIIKWNDDRISIRQLQKLYDYYQKKNIPFKVMCNGVWKDAIPIKIPYNRKWYKVVLRNGSEMKVTDNHIHFTKDGEKKTKELIIGDFIKFGRNKISNKSKRGRRSLGEFIGYYIADGYYACNGKDDGKVGFTINKNKGGVIYDIEKMVEKVGGYYKTTQDPSSDKTVVININSKAIKSLITEFVTGNTAKEKRLTNVIWKMSSNFHRGVLLGWSKCDGRKRLSNINGSSASIGLIHDFYKLCIILGKLPSINNYKRKTGIKRVSNVECVTTSLDDSYLYSLNTHKTKIKNENRKRINHNTDKIYQQIFHDIKGETYTQIVSIEEYTSNRAKYAYCLSVEDGNSFQLPNGVITHNCGMPDTGDKWFSKFSRKQMTAVIVQAKRSYEKGEVRLFNYNDWKPEWAHETLFHTMVASGNWHNYRKKLYVTFGDHMRKKWNNPKHPRGPYQYFEKVLKPIGIDKNSGDLVYVYDKWNINDLNKFDGIRNF